MLAELFQVACATMEKPQRETVELWSKGPNFSFWSSPERVRDVIAAGHAYCHAHFLSNSPRMQENLFGQVMLLALFKVARHSLVDGFRKSLNHRLVTVMGHILAPKATSEHPCPVLTKPTHQTTHSTRSLWNKEKDKRLSAGPLRATEKSFEKEGSYLQSPPLEPVLVGLLLSSDI